MMRLWMTSALMAILAFPVAGHAVVDMKNSNYADTWIDISLPGTGYAQKFQRNYQSRSVHSGMVGHGWCTDFETSLEIMAEDRLKLRECGAGQEVIYASAKYSDANLDKTVNEIIAYYKKTNPSATQQTVDTLKEQLREYSDLRSSWAKQAGLKLPEIKKGSVYVAENLEVEKITWDGTNYTRALADGTSQKFDSSGRLVSLFDKNGNTLKLAYNGDKLKEIVDNTGRKLNFVFYPQTRRVKEITGPQGVKVEYKYDGEDLIEVRNMWSNKYTYKYDDNHNLTRIDFPDKTFKALTYNQKNDWVTSFTDRAIDGVACTETYNYEMDKANPKDHFWSTAVKKCGKEVKNEARFEFWHKTRADGRKYLARVLTKSLTDTLDVSYHPEFGRPISIKKNNVTTSFDYYDNGLIREKSTQVARMFYEYKNPYNKVSKVATEFFGQNGKVARKRETTFEYDGKANLITAQNSDGQFVKLTYDARGRIATIIDQAKKEVQIRFDDKTGKPSSITRPKVGTINIAYKPNGEINKVESSDGPTVAVQIASTFNNLLDIIAPATSELNL